MLFSALPDALRRELAQNALRREYLDDQIIQQRGERARGFYLIETGSVAVGQFLRSGDFRGVAILGPGDSWGELAMFAKQPRVVDAISRGKSTVRIIGEVQFETMLATHPSVMRDLLSAMSNQMQEMLNIIAGIRRGSALPRVAGLLVSLAGTDPAHNSVAITQSELAELLGLTRATVNSALGELQSWGALERSYGAIRIIDRGALEDASLE